MANITTYLSKILKAVYGKDVRTSIHNAIDAINTEVQSTTDRQEQIEDKQKILENQFNNEIANLSVSDPSNAEIVAARTNVDGNNFTTIGLRLNDIEYKIKDLYIKPEWATSYSESNASTAIQNILNAGYRVLLSKNKTYNISTKITVPANGWIEGQGENSVLKAIVGFKTNIIEVEKETTQSITLKNFCVHGDIENQSTGFNGIYINNSTSQGNYHNIDHIWVKNIPGIGFYLKGGGDSYINNINVTYCNGNGIELYTFDNRLFNLNAGSVGGNAIDITGANNKFIGCKGWWAQGYGIYMQGNRNLMSACDVQDCLIGGFFIAGSNNNIQANIDGVGERGTSMRKDDIAAITLGITDLYAYTDFNIASFTVADRMEYYPTEGTTDYLIDISGANANTHITHNNITAIFNNVKKGVFKNPDTSQSTYNITGSLGYYGTAKEEVNYIISPYITGAIKTATISSATENILEKYHSTASIRYNIKTSVIAGGTNIGTVSTNCLPVFSVDLTARCYDTSSNFLGLCTVNIASVTGNITIWEVPANTTQIVIIGQYVSK